MPLTLPNGCGLFGSVDAQRAVVAVVLVLIWPILRLSPIHRGDMPAWYVVIVPSWVSSSCWMTFVPLDAPHHAQGWLLKHVHSIHHRIRHTTAIMVITCTRSNTCARQDWL